MDELESFVKFIKEKFSDNEIKMARFINETDLLAYTMQTEKVKEGDKFVVEGKAVYRIMSRVNMDDNESLYYFHRCLENTGINAKLKEMKIQEGDIVKMLDWEFEWYE